MLWRYGLSRWLATVKIALLSAFQIPMFDSGMDGPGRAKLRTVQRAVMTQIMQSTKLL